MEGIINFYSVEDKEGAMTNNNNNNNKYKTIECSNLMSPFSKSLSDCPI
jgi:hypothetical protein